MLSCEYEYEFETVGETLSNNLNDINDSLDNVTERLGTFFRQVYLGIDENSNEITPSSNENAEASIGANSIDSDTVTSLTAVGLTACATTINVETSQWTWEKLLKSIKSAFEKVRNTVQDIAQKIEEGSRYLFGNTITDGGIAAIKRKAFEVGQQSVIKLVSLASGIISPIATPLLIIATLSTACYVLYKLFGC